MDSACVGQYRTARSTSARRLSGGFASSSSTTPFLGTVKTSGASTSHMACPWHRSVSTTMRISGAPLPVLHLARLLQLHNHLGVVVAVAFRRLRHLELVVLQQHREDRLELHQRERGTDAAVPARAERDPGPPVDDVFLVRVDV